MDMVREYEENGYVIVPGLIPDAKIDNLVDRLERFKKGRRPYWSESIHTWMAPELDDRGFLVQSMENFTRLWWSGGLNEAGNDILLGPEIQGVMRRIKPGHQEFVHWLNHLFDRSTGSIDHIDSWYLDSDPAGDLIGAWIALEDIHPDSGPFRLFPKSHTLPDLDKLWEMDHESFRKHCAKLANTLEPKFAIIEKGTVVFFNSYILHGAVDQRDPRYSRKSITGHYLPRGILRRERHEQTEPREVRLAREMSEARHVGGRPIAVTHTFASEMNFNLRGLASYAKHMFGPRRQGMDMRRSSYAER